MDIVIVGISIIGLSIVCMLGIVGLMKVVREIKEGNKRNGFK